jgi:hypothetical protein
MTVNVTNTVGANNTIVLDGSSKIPAFDGSLVTALSATAFTTGSLATARIDVGTTAGKILQLDSNAKYPAVSGANLTNAPGPTVSASDPTISTNPTLGAKWINTTSGEVYICTDATAGANVWTNVGAGSGDVVFWGFPGESYGYRAGGGNPVTNVVDRVSFTSDGNATDIGDLTVARHWTAGATDFSTYGYTMSGGSGVAVIDRFAFAGTFSCTDVGDILQTHTSHAGASSPQGYGYYSGGANTTHIDKFQMSASANSTDVGDLTTSREESGGTCSITYGYVVGGYSGGDINIIEKFPFASDTNSADVGNLVAGTSGAGGTSASATHGYLANGSQGGATNMIQKWTFASDANATDVADTAYSSYHPGGASATAYGYVWGGRNPYYNNINKYAYASDANGTDVGDLTQAIGYTTAGLQV